MSAIAAHYTGSGLVHAVTGALEREGLGSGSLTVDDVGLVAEFHTGGRAATLALADAAALREGLRVLDAGCGAGGPALVLASQYGCTVTGIDLTPEFCRLAELFAERTGLSDRFAVREGDVLELPFEDAAFDAAWTMHVQMNVADKPRFYRELRRVLVGGGTLAFWDIVRGENRDPLTFPVPWASDPEHSFLAGYDELREHVRAAGFEERLAEDGTDEAIAFVTTMEERFAEGPPPLALHLIVPNAPAKFAGFSENVRAGKLRLLRGVYTAV